MQLWEPDPLFVRVGAVHQGNVANSLNEVSGSLPAQFSDHGIAAFLVRHPKPDFDQLMMRNRGSKFP